MNPPAVVCYDLMRSLTKSQSAPVIVVELQVPLDSPS